MDKEIQSQINKKLIKCIILTIFIYLILIIIPVDHPTGNIELCIFKRLTGKECFNCGMTRACLNVLHFNFNTAFNYNHNVVVVFPTIAFIYIYKMYKYIIDRRRI